MTELQLRLERKDQAPGGELVPGVMITPNLDETYWTYRVCLSEGQAVLGFPKFGVIGCGFAVEAFDWNRNLPINCPVEEIVDHIWPNAGPGIERVDVVAAVTLIRDAARSEGAPGRWSCVHCDREIRQTGDDVAPWVHESSGNSFCDVHSPADAVALAGQEGRTEAEPA